MAGTADIGLIGLAVMGQNLALNMSDRGFTVAVYNRTPGRTEEFVSGAAAQADIVGAYSLEELAGWLRRPRRVLLMVKAGPAVDTVIAELIRHLEPGDIIIDGGNSHYQDSIRRARDLEARGFHFLGTGISGGEEGARHGPSIMPGGSPQGWHAVREILQAVAARVADGTPCCEWIGPDGAGHYVKMVHNGIEYGDMQLIAEAYHVMRTGLGMSHAEMGDVFESWNRGRLDSYLIAITSAIMRKTEDGEPLLERILDTAGQKGTGRWTAVAALEAGVPTTLVAEAVFARVVSALKDQRTAASRVLGTTSPGFDDDRDLVLADLEHALYASKIVSYAQGFMLMADASAEHEWNLDYGAIALLWREGCIIRAAFLDEIRDAYGRDPALANLLLDPYFTEAVSGAQDGWRRTVARAALAGIP
ncbi:MAG TPA: NADP-dependent phosphogluconate dehydrogenase, partial [Gemmatimonadales bacterium]|nr:NADP-dependent phosphogluconate dehydrogenase [Gemmatimonadales bacterium]